MAGGRQIPADVIDLREYKKNNQVRDIKNLVIQPFSAEANKTYLLGAIPKGAAIQSINKFTATAVGAAATDIKVGDINNVASETTLTANKVYVDGGDIWIKPTVDQTNGYIISYMNTGITDGAYAG
jgi:hypothetical protein